MYLKGQSATERAVIVGLVAVVGIGALNILSGALQTQSDKMTAGVSGTIGGMLTMPGNGATATGAGVTGGGTVATATGTGGLNITSSYPVNAAGFEQMMNDLPDLIETSGASGSSKELMGYLSKLSDELLAKGEISNEEHNLLKDLSNAGHYSANVQEALEKALSSADELTLIKDIKTIPVTVEGVTKSFDQ